MEETKKKMDSTGTVRNLTVEVVDARNLMPKDGHGTSSPYVVIDFYGQRKRTQTAIRDLNPTWNEVLEFNVGPPSTVFGDVLELHVHHDRSNGPTRRSNFLGRIRLSSAQFVRKGEEALIYFTLEKKSLFSWIQGEIGLKIYYSDHEATVPPPQSPPADELTESNQTSPADGAANGEKNQTSADEGVANGEKIDDVSASPSLEPEQPQQVKPQEQGDATQTVEKPTEGNVENEKVTLETTSSKDNQDQIGSSNENKVEEAPLETASLRGDQDEISSVSKSEQEIKLGPRPIRRPVSSSGEYSLESGESPTIDRSSFDLVEKMHYLFVRVVKARSLPTSALPIVKIEAFGQRTVSKSARKINNLFEWDQTFAFGRDTPDESPSMLEISVWDPTTKNLVSNFLGGLCFEATEILLRDPPDSPLAPQWYKLEKDDAFGGYLMLATWIGTQADEAFADAWKTDTADSDINSQAKVYQSPKLWYLRATILEAQDIIITPLITVLKEASFQIKAQLGFQESKTKTTFSRNGAPSWNEDLLFVAAEPLTDHLIFTLVNRQSKSKVIMGVCRIPLTEIERRVDDRKVTARWFTLSDPEDKESVFKGRIQLKLCFDGGYHVMDEAAHVCSDYRPTARQLWKPPVGSIELGVIGCRNLLPMKMVNGPKGSTDAYCVAKYGSKWVRTRTICNSLEPKWNEQYTWKVYDPCTVLTIAVFDSSHQVLKDNDMSNEARTKLNDLRIGKVRIRISTLQIGKVYRNIYPLLILSNTGSKKMGELEIAIRFVRDRASSTLDFIHVYSQPLLPLMHHVKPVSVLQLDKLRTAAVKLLATHFSKSEPPLRSEVIFYMLDADSQNFSMRKVRANWNRIVKAVAGVIDVVKWVEDTRSWKNSTATILVHALLVMLVWFPDLIIPTLAFYMFVIGAWNYRFRSRDPVPHFDSKISLADIVDRDELDEEFDQTPSTKSEEIVRARYEKLRTIGTRVQTVLGDFAAQCERVQAVVTWRDPRATGIFIVICFAVAMILYMVPSKMVGMAFGFYYLRHPIFRDRQPSAALNFFRRLPSLSDRIM